ncbi:MAG: SCO family protein [Myxococcota bacterium]|nr:SCO family protein [Myxococcota bacterium]
MVNQNLKFIGTLCSGLLVLFLASHAHAAFVKLPNPVPLSDDSLKLLRNASPSGGQSWKLVVFGFTHCSDICPRSLETLSRLVKVAREKQIGLDGIFVSIDPHRDTDSVLERYTGPFGKNTSYLRLEEQALDRFKDQFGVEAVFYTKNRGNDFFYQVDHSTTAFFVDPTGNIRLVFDALEDFNSAETMIRENQAFFQ